MKTIASLLPLLLLLIGCSKDNLSYELNETIPLQYDHTAEVLDGSQSFSIQFVGVKEDRCPPDVNCIASGTVTIDLKVEGNTQQVRFGNPQPDNEIGVTTSYNEYTIELVSVSYGRDANYGKDSKYKVELIVS